MSYNHTRQDLIDLCELGCTPQDQWGDRDSASAVRQLGGAWALLRAGCPFKVMTERNTHATDVCETDERTIWIEIAFTGFQSFEYGKREGETDTFYIPTQQRLDDANGEDWY